MDFEWTRVGEVGFASVGVAELGALVQVGRVGFASTKHLVAAQNIYTSYTFHDRSRDGRNRGRLNKVPKAGISLAFFLLHPV